MVLRQVGRDDAGLDPGRDRLVGLARRRRPDGRQLDRDHWHVVSALLLISRYVQWFTTNFVITSDRVIFRTGVFGKHGIEIPLERVNNVIFHQSFIERMLGCGDLLIESGGEQGQQRFTEVRNPDNVQALIHTQVDAKLARRGQAASGGGAATGDVASQLEKLEGMLQRGTLTPSEFEAQKRKLLGA